MIMGTNLKIVSKGGNIYAAITKICIKKNWIDYLKLRIFWEVVLWDSKSQTVGD